VAHFFQFFTFKAKLPQISPNMLIIFNSPVGERWKFTVFQKRRAKLRIHHPPVNQQTPGFPLNLHVMERVEKKPLRGRWGLNNIKKLQFFFRTEGKRQKWITPVLATLQRGCLSFFKKLCFAVTSTSRAFKKLTAG